MVVPACYVFMMREGEILLLLRVNTGYHDGDYGLPAGHVEVDELPTAAAIRESKEEVGVLLARENIQLVHTQYRHCGDHERVDFFFAAEFWEGEPTNMEPDKCDEIRWTPLAQLPANMVPHEAAALAEYQKGNTYSQYHEAALKTRS